MFIETLAATASVGAAAASIGVSRTALYKLRNAPRAHAFRAAWDAALKVAISVLADTAFERAVEGVDEHITWKGETMGYRRRYNDRLLMYLMRVRDPANYAPLAELGAWSEVRAVENHPATLGTAPALPAAGAPPPPAPPTPPLPPNPMLAIAHTCKLRQLEPSRAPRTPRRKPQELTARRRAPGHDPQEPPS